MSQLKLVFQLDRPVLPKELDRLLVSFLKASIQNYSEPLFNQLYDKGKSIIKTYTFAYYLPGARFQGDTIQLSQSTFTMYFSDADLGEFIHFFNAFRLMKSKSYPVSGNSMVLVSVIPYQKKEVVDSEIVVKMQSSLLARRHDSETNTDQYFTYDQEEFGEVIKENVKSFLEKTGLKISDAGFSITPVKGKKVVVPVFGRNTDASLGVYRLTGTPELLNLLYLAGIGSRRSESHGKFEILL